MSGHDAASNVGRIAGMDDTPSHPPITPTLLRTRFAYKGTEQEGKATVSRGFCGYSGLRSRGAEHEWMVGFDDGYCFMGELGSRGWRDLPSKGDWPYVVYMVWQAQQAEQVWAVAEYIEADFTLWVFRDRVDLQVQIATFRDCP